MARIKESIATERHLAYNLEMVKKLRLKLSLSQEELADEIGIGFRTLQRIEAGGKPSKLAAQAIEAWVKEVEWQDRVATKGVSDK